MSARTQTTTGAPSCRGRATKCGPVPPRYRARQCSTQVCCRVSARAIAQSNMTQGLAAGVGCVFPMCIWQPKPPPLPATLAYADLDISHWLRWTTPANTLYYTKIMDIAGVGSATFLINAVSDASILLWDDGQV
jgi:hypothetical protein